MFFFSLMLKPLITSSRMSQRIINIVIMQQKMYPTEIINAMVNTWLSLFAARIKQFLNIMHSLFFAFIIFSLTGKHKNKF